MAWAKLDDKFHSHVTTIRAGLEANGLFVRAISYCADHLTDGFVPEEWVRHQTRKVSLYRKLEEEGLWERIEGGWYIPDFLTYNPSREQVVERRQRRAEAGRKAIAIRWAKERGEAE